MFTAYRVYFRGLLPNEISLFFYKLPIPKDSIFKKLENEPPLKMLKKLFWKQSL